MIHENLLKRIVEYGTNEYGRYIFEVTEGDRVQEAREEYEHDAPKIIITANGKTDTFFIITCYQKKGLTYFVIGDDGEVVTVRDFDTFLVNDDGNSAHSINNVGVTYPDGTHFTASVEIKS